MNITKYRSAINNIGYLGLVQIINILFPLITYPYLINVLGSENYGKVIYYQGISAFLSIFISYGFNLTAARDISRLNVSSSEVSLKYCEVMASKILLFIPSFIIYIIIGSFLLGNEHVYVFCIGPMLSELFFPIWLFQGLEKLKYSAIITAISKSILLITILLYVNHSSDLMAYAILLFLNHVLISLISIFYCIYFVKIKIKKIKLTQIIIALRSGYSVFISTFFTAIKDKLNVILVGHFLGHSEVVIYDMAIKILGIVSVVQNVITTAFFARISKLKETLLIYRLFFIVNSLNVILFFCVCIFTNYFIEIIIPTINEMDKVIILMVTFTVIPIGVSSILARFYLIPFSYDKLLKITVIINCLIYLLFLFIYYVAYESYSLVDFAKIMILSAIFELCIRSFACFKMNKKNKDLKLL